MAVSPIFIRRLKRMIEILRDPYPMDEQDQLTLSEMLTEDEKAEVERRRQEIYHINSLMLAWEVNELPWIDEIPSINFWNTNIPVIVAEGMSVRNRIAKRERKIERIKQMGYKNPNVLATEQSLLENDMRLLENAYVNYVFHAHEKHSPEALRWIVHRGPRTLGNLPRPVESWENAFWPNHPNANRQAHIEVLEIKLKRLIREADSR